MLLLVRGRVGAGMVADRRVERCVGGGAGRGSGGNLYWCIL